MEWKHESDPWRWAYELGVTDAFSGCTYGPTNWGPDDMPTDKQEELYPCWLRGWNAGNDILDTMERESNG